MRETISKSLPKINVTPRQVIREYVYSWINFVRVLNDGEIDINIPGRTSQVIAE